MTQATAIENRGDVERETARVGLIPAKPALLAAVCFIGGILLHDRVTCVPLFWGALTFCLAILAAICIDHARIASGSLILSLSTAGIGIAQLEGFYFPRDEISAYTTDTPRLAWMELHIEHEPRILTDPYSKHPLPPKQVATARVTSVKTWDGWKNCTGGILLQIRQPHPRLAAWQRIRVLGKLERPSAATNPGQFDWAHYYRNQRIIASLHIDAASNIQIISEAPPTVPGLIRQQSRRLLASGFAAEDSLDHALLRALVLGDNDPELRDIQEQFRRTGTSHHLSISGLHVAVLAAFVFGICRLLRLRPRTSVLMTSAFIALYGVAALPSPPVVRSVLLGIFVGIGLATGRHRDPVQLLCISVFAMLIYKPLDLFSAGFQLSFGVVLGLIIFTPPLDKWLRNYNASDWPLTRQPTRSTFSMFLDYFSRAFAAGFVAWIISMPLVAYHFGQVNPWAVVASVVLAPFVFIALIGGFLKIILTLLFPGGAIGWAWLASGPMHLMQTILGWLDRIPGSDFPFPAPPIWLITVFYAFCLMMLLPYRRPKWHLLIRFGPVILCAFALLLPAFRVNANLIPDATLKMTLLSVGAGQCAVIEAPGGKTVLIDAGSTSLTDALRKCIAPFLREKGVTHIDQLLLTHSDYDHISSVGEIAEVYDVREVLCGPRFRAIATENFAADHLLRQLDAMNLPPRIISTGERIPLSRDAEIEVIASPKDPNLSSNDSGIVCRIHYAGRSILFTGDIQEVGMRTLLRSGQNLRADVLIAPHHGSSEISTSAFIDAINPSTVLSSNDRSLTGKQKRLDALLKDRTLLRTNECGAITVTIHVDGRMQVERFLISEAN